MGEHPFYLVYQTELELLSFGLGSRENSSSWDAAAAEEQEEQRSLHTRKSLHVHNKYFNHVFDKLHFTHGSPSMLHLFGCQQNRNNEWTMILKVKLRVSCIYACKQIQCVCSLQSDTTVPRLNTCPLWLLIGAVQTKVCPSWITTRFVDYVRLWYIQLSVLFVVLMNVI